MTLVVRHRQIAMTLDWFISLNQQSQEIRTYCSVANTPQSLAITKPFASAVSKGSS